MAAAVMGHICRVRSEFLCPGSPVDLNHWAKVETVIFNDCDHVRAEMLARIDLQESGHWHDPHINGAYTAIDRSHPRRLLVASTNTRSNDLIGYNFLDARTPQGPACAVRGCSQSQLYTYSVDDSDQYCNIVMLYCGRSSNCKPVQYDFFMQEVQVETSPGGGKDIHRCFRMRWR